MGFREVSQHYLYSVDFNSENRGFPLHIKMGKSPTIKILYSGASLGIQWLGLCAHDAGSQIPSLVRELPRLKDPIHSS